MNKLLDNPIFVGLMAVALTVYGPRLSPRLPDSIRNAFNNSYFRFAVILLIIFLGTRDIRLSIIVALLFVTIMSITNVQNMREEFDNCVVEYFNIHNIIDKVAPTKKMKKDIVEYFESGDLLNYAEDSKEAEPSEEEKKASKESIQGLVEHFENVSKHSKKDDTPLNVSELVQ